MAIIDDVKVALRVAPATVEFNGEIQGLIDAAEADLQLAGVIPEKVDVADPLIKRAIVVYCKANFGYDNPDADRLQRAYDLLKMHLTLAEDYVCYAVTFTVTSVGLPVDEAEITIDEVTKETNSLGVAVFTTTLKNVDLDYKVSKSGYITVESSVYVDGNKAVGVVLVAA